MSEAYGFRGSDVESLLAAAQAVNEGDEAEQVPVKGVQLFTVREQRIVVGGVAGYWWGIRHHTGWWYCTRYRIEGVAIKEAEELTLQWCEGYPTILVASFADTKE